MTELVSRFSKERALALQEELLTAFNKRQFQAQLYKHIESCGYDSLEFKKAQQELVLSVQKGILPKYGFAPTIEGVCEMRLAIGKFSDDDEVSKNTHATNKLIGKTRDKVAEMSRQHAWEQLHESADAPVAAKVHNGNNVQSLTRDSALSLQRKLLKQYSRQEFQSKLIALYAKHGFSMEFKKGRKELVIPIQHEILPKYGFAEGTAGSSQMIDAFKVFSGDDEISANIETINHLLGWNFGKTENGQILSEQSKQGSADQIRPIQSDQYYKVVGDTRGGGILVRLAEDTYSKAHPEPLGTGSIIKPVSWGRMPGRLYYEKVNGVGPDCGWVSMKVQDTQLLEPYCEEGASSENMTKQQVLKLQQELQAKYAAGSFQKQLQLISDKHGRSTPQYRQARQNLVLDIQKAVLPNHGFEANDQGVAKMRKAISGFPDDIDIQENIRAISDLLNVRTTT